MKVVLDTNVIVSGLLFPGGVPDRVVRAALTGQIQNVTSPDLLQEVRRVFDKKFKIPEKRLEGLIRFVADMSDLVYPLERLRVISADPPDNRVLECAITGEAEFIITGDAKHLLKLKSFRSISIVSPAQFAQMGNLI